MLWTALSLGTPIEAVAAGKVAYVLRPATSHAGTTPQQLAATFRLHQEALAPAATDMPPGLGPAWVSNNAPWLHLAGLQMAGRQRQATTEVIATQRARCRLSDIAPNAP
ncbi:hypothetical protein [Hymenobacter sp. DG25A]|uniref:hypothetical protein n=1 Tax=Hymenobacter sp. DG25A TaxID=1385663 RepID=UPI0006BCC2DD|nr:hypothetical protein [Hymenobacter sp. DG25A]ALD20261.1 hypothetical protein AM218_02210 [Hymenobacter sp. DG25A]